MTARRIYVPEAMPSRDANGRAVPAKLKFYAPGSALDTLKPVYTDDTLTTPYSQPVLSNADGQFPPIWADGDETFDVGWYDQTFGRQLGTWQNVIPATRLPDPDEPVDPSDLDSKLNKDLSNLASTASVYEGRLRFGNQSGWAESTFPFTESIAQVLSVAEGGAPVGNIRTVGLLGISRTSDCTITGAMGCIGAYGLALNNNTTQVQVAYAGYMEATRLTGAGRTHALEVGIINKGEVGDITPNDTSTAALTAGLWVSAGRTDVGTVTNVSVGLGFIDNGAKFRKGIVFGTNSIDSSTNIALATDYAHKWAWYNSSGAIVSEMAGDHLWGHVIGNTAGTGYELHFLRERSSAAATLSGDVIGQEIYKGWNGTSFYEVAHVKVTQTGAWSGTTGPAAMELSVVNSGGTTTKLTVGGASNASVTPGGDNNHALGSTSLRFADIYSNQFRPGPGGPIWTSGAGVPNGVVTAPVGSLYTRIDGGAATTLYVKESGTGNTGWVAK